MRLGSQLSRLGGGDEHAEPDSGLQYCRFLAAYAIWVCYDKCGIRHWHSMRKWLYFVTKREI